jgi:hypothetical protein
MKKLTALLLLVSLLSFLGCGHFPMYRDRVDTKAPTWNPKVEDLVFYLNDNAKRVQAVQCNLVQADVSQGMSGIGFDGNLIFEKPHNLRFKARLMGADGVDIGSNNDEFWFWISKAQTPYVNHCSYSDLAKSNGQIDFPFQPEFLIAALGVQEYDPNGKYEVKTNRDTVELIESTTSPSGQPIQKIVVFNRNEMKPPNPQVLSLTLRDTKGKDILLVQYRDTQVVGSKSAILPLHLEVTMPQPDGKPAKLKLFFRDMKAVQVPVEQGARIFSRADLMVNKQGFDIARGRPDTPGGNSGLRPVDGIQFPPR